MITKGLLERLSAYNPLLIAKKYTAAVETVDSLDETLRLKNKRIASLLSDLDDAAHEAEGLFERLQLNAHINAKLLTDLHEEKQNRIRAETAIYDIMKFEGDGENDGWPCGTHYADAIGPLVDRLRAEVARLQALLMDQVENTSVHSVKIKNGSIDVAVRPPHWAIKAMAGSFLETLDNAPNWRAIEIGPIPSDGGMLIVTVCRASGESPVETVGKMRTMIERLLAWMPMHGVDQITLEALALINPEKKDTPS